ncbi:MAG: hypothetical protein GXX79_03655 [Actinomycetales bacterium]|nr:hypothetical protein [Actinomycetales bacterium]
MASIDPSTLTPERLAPMLRAWAAGLYAEEAAVDLLIAHRTWLTRRDFLTRLVDVETEAWTPGGIPVPQASIDWDTVAMFTDGGALPASSSETVILRLAASLAGTPMTTSVRDLTAHLDPVNGRYVLDALAHRWGWHRRGLTHTVTGDLPGVPGNGGTW